MDPKHKKLLTRNLLELCKLIDVERLKPQLLMKEVFSESMLQDLTYGHPPQQQKQNIILCLPKRGPYAMNCFMTSLTDAGLFEAAALLRPELLELEMMNAFTSARDETLFPTQIPEIREVVVKKSTMITNSLQNGLLVYQMKSRPRGIAALFINETFENGFYNSRTGASVDKRHLHSLFDQLGYMVKEYNDCTLYEMKSQLTLLSKNESLKEMDSFIMVISSHGDNGSIATSDNEHIKVTDILSYFYNDKCPNLHGKPKIFIIQACRGNDFDTGVLKGAEQTDAQPFGNRTKAADIIPNKKDDKDILPTETDVLIAYSTVPGKVSYRHPLYGSWYINLLVETVMNNAWKMHLSDMLTLVNTKMARLKTSRGEMKQSSETVWRGWRKVLYFNPGL